MKTKIVGFEICISVPLRHWLNGKGIISRPGLITYCSFEQRAIGGIAGEVPGAIWAWNGVSNKSYSDSEQCFTPTPLSAIKKDLEILSSVKLKKVL